MFKTMKMKKLNGPNERKIARMIKETPKNPSKNSSKSVSEDQIPIGTVNTIPIVATYIVGDDLSLEDQKRIDAGKSVIFNIEGEAPRVKNRPKGTYKSGWKPIMSLKPPKVILTRKEKLARKAALKEMKKAQIAEREAKTELSESDPRPQKVTSPEKIKKKKTYKTAYKKITALKPPKLLPTIKEKLAKVAAKKVVTPVKNVQGVKPVKERKKSSSSDEYTDDTESSESDDKVKKDVKPEKVKIQPKGYAKAETKPIGKEKSLKGADTSKDKTPKMAAKTKKDDDATSKEKISKKVAKTKKDDDATSKDKISKKVAKTKKDDDATSKDKISSKDAETEKDVKSGKHAQETTQSNVFEDDVEDTINSDSILSSLIFGEPDTKGKKLKKGKQSKLTSTPPSKKQQPIKKTIKDEKIGDGPNEKKQLKDNTKAKGKSKTDSELESPSENIIPDSEDTLPPINLDDLASVDSSYIDLFAKDSLEGESEITSYEEEEELEEETIDFDLADEDFSISSDSLDNFDNFTFLRDHTVKPKSTIEDVVEYPFKVPNIDEISLDQSILRFQQDLEKPSSRKPKAKKAVEPVVKDDKAPQDKHEKMPAQVEEELDIERIDEEVEEEGEEEGGVAEFDELSGSSSLNYEFASTSDEVVTTAKADERIPDEDLFDAMIKGDSRPFNFEEIDFENLARIAERRLMEKDIRAYVEVLIQSVADAVEYVDPDDITREKVNKVFLFRHLMELLFDYNIEININRFLSKKCTELFRLQKTYVTITPEQDETVLERDQNRYQEVITDLGAVLGRESDTAAKISKMENDSREELNQLENQYKKLTEDFHELLYKTLCRNDRATEHLIKFIKKQISEMTALQNEISKKRSVLIRVQHLLGRLKDKKREMENFGPNLKMQSYENVRDEISQLGVALEYRNIYLDKLRKRYNVSINVIAHFRQNKILLYETVQNQLSEYQQLINEKQDFLHYIHLLKKQRIPLQKKFWEMNFQFGLINKPELCIDFDQTDDRILEMREVVKRLKNQINSIERKIAAKCPPMRPESTIGT